MALVRRQFPMRRVCKRQKKKKEKEAVQLKIAKGCFAVSFQ